MFSLMNSSSIGVISNHIYLHEVQPFKFFSDIILNLTSLAVVTYNSLLL